MEEKVYVLIHTYSSDTSHTECSVYSKKEDAEKAFNKKREELIRNHGELKAIEYNHSLILHKEKDEDMEIEDNEYHELTIEEQKIL